MFRYFLSRIVTWIVLIAFGNLCLQPLEAAAQTCSDRKQSVSERASDGYARHMSAMDAAARRCLAKSQKGEAIDGDVASLISQKQALEGMEANVEAEFGATELHLMKHHISPEILQRLTRSIDKFRADNSELKSLLNETESAQKAKDSGARQAALLKLSEFLKKNEHKRSHPPIDPKNMPFRRAGKKARPPRETKREYRSVARKMNSINPATRHAAGSDTSQSIATILSAPLTLDSVSSWLSNAFVAPALAQGPQGAQSLPTPDDLAQTEDVQLTPAVKELAATLGNNPVSIFNWVTDNTTFIPTYGSIQGSEMTLTSGQGNDFDTASLLIAVLRAANIPARYVYGTIDVPAADVVNWIGGATSPAAALDLMGQGGIPCSGTISAPGGPIQTIRMEHVWVEAWFGYLPSRGVMNHAGNGWIPMDPSFKHNTITQGQGIASAVPFDAKGAVNQVIAAAQVNLQQGSISGVDMSLIQNAISNYRDSVQSYVAANYPNSSVVDILGSETIVARDDPILLGTLPYKVVAQGGEYSAIPANLRHTVTVQLSGTNLSYTISLPALNSQRLGVTFLPASDADAQVIQSYKDEGAASLPVYLINVQPVIQVEGVAVAVGPPVAMGSDQEWNVTLVDPQGLYTGSTLFDTHAGDEIVFGIDGDGIAPALVQQRLENVNPGSAAENLQEAALHYWMEYDAFDYLTAKANGVREQRLPSVGLFSSPLAVSYLWGVPQSGNYQGRHMDVRRSVIGSAADNSDTLRAFMVQAGIQGSYLEGSIFDQLFMRPQSTAYSAAQILMDASQQNVPIYRITQDNIQSVLPLLTVGDDVKSDIIDTVEAGNIAIVPQGEITHGGWVGTGYILQDAQTGAGTYLISGLCGGGQPACATGLAPEGTSAVAGNLAYDLEVLTEPESVGGGMAVAGEDAATAAAFIEEAGLGLELGGLIPVAGAVIGIAFILVIVLMMVAIIHQSMVDDAVVAATGSDDYTCKPNSNCADEFPNLRECSALGPAYKYNSLSQVKKAVAKYKYVPNVKEGSEETTYGGPCPGQGKHLNLNYKSQWTGITTFSCPCCEDTPSGPDPNQIRWATNPNF